MRAYFLDGFREIEPHVWGREDVYDLGAGYRAVIALPGGFQSRLMAQLREGNVHNMTLVPGTAANWTDTMGTNSVWILDSSDLLFHQAEVCLQFHDPQGSTYPQDYHALREVLLANGKLKETQGHLTKSIKKQTKTYRKPHKHMSI